MLTATVVISTYTVDRMTEVLHCIEALQHQTVTPLEILLVLDPNEEVVEAYRKVIPPFVTLVVSSAKGLSAARNCGIERARGDVVAFIDDDAFAEPSWLAALMENFQDGQVAVVGGKIVPAWAAGRPAWFAEELDWLVGCTYAGHAEGRSEVRNVIGASMAVRRSAAALVPGGFRTDIGRVGKILLGSEEMEYCVKLRANASRAKVIYDPAAIVYHHVPASRARIRYALRRAYGEGISKRILSRTLPARKTFREENAYVKFLLKRSVPARLKRPWTRGALGQLCALGLVLGATAAGYVAGIRRAPGNPSHRAAAVTP